MRLFNFLAIVGIFFTGVCLIFHALDSMYPGVTDQDIAVFMKSPKYLQWSGDSVSRAALYPALSAWKESIDKRNARFTAVAGGVCIVATGILAFAMRQPRR